MSSRRRMLMKGNGDTPIPSLTDYYYYLGDECLSLSGGWSKAASTGDQEASFLVTKESQYIHIYSICSSGCCKGVKTLSKFKTSDYSKKIIVLKMNSIVTRYPEYAILSGCIWTTRSVYYQADGTETFYTYNNDVPPMSTQKIFVSEAHSQPGDSDYSKHTTNNMRGYRDDWCDKYDMNLYVFAYCYADDITSLSSYGNTISDIVANSASLLSDRSAVQTLARCSGDLMWSCLADSAFITNLAASSYKNIIEANYNWRKAIIAMNAA